MNGAPTPDSATFRRLVGQFATGLTVVSALDRGAPVGFTCQAFASVSLDPPLVSICVATSSTSYPRMRRRGRFAVSVLAADQQWIAEQLARRSPDKWSGIGWHATGSGNPAICSALAWLDCTIVAEHLAGDHWIVLGRVDELDAERGAGEPLVYHQGGLPHPRRARGPRRVADGGG